VTPDDIRQAVIDTLARIAPEIRSAPIQPGANLRDQFDIDSMDFLNFVVALHERLGVAIPEADYGKLLTLDAIVGYVAVALNAQPRPAS
jgi:acyl carrier protein